MSKRAARLGAVSLTYFESCSSFTLEGSTGPARSEATEISMTVFAPERYLPRAFQQQH